MKTYLSPTQLFISTIQPSDEPNKFHDTIRPYLPYCSQQDFNKVLQLHPFEETGFVYQEEIDVVMNIKTELARINEENRGINSDRLEFDYAIAFHRSLKKLKWGKAITTEIGMWRYLSLNYFKEEVFHRRGKTFFDKSDHVKAAKITFDHCFGSRTRDIFPRRYFIIGERLFSQKDQYDLLKKLSALSKRGKEGGFGNLIANLIETSLLSPNDYVSKVMSKVMFSDKRLANDKEVAKAFVRYNGFKSRLLNDAIEKVFAEEICVPDSTK
ncbi:MAG: hypothetical protein WKG06_38935 [Segetibacter sp.]